MYVAEENSSIGLQLNLPKVLYGLPHTHQNIADNNRIGHNAKSVQSFQYQNEIFATMRGHRSKPSLWRQELKNSVLLFRLEPVCIIITFSVSQSRHILEEGVKG